MSTTEEPVLEFPEAAPPPAVREAVLRLLRSDPVTLGHGEDVTGRPHTQVYRDRQHLLKIRGELSFSPHDAKRWVLNKSREERDLGVYHPDKIWMLVRDSGGVHIANLAPLLNPLHVALTGKTPEAAMERLGDVAGMVLSIGAGHGKLLDSGLSNFGEDAAGRLFYLDDDIYRWDRFLALSQSLIHWFRVYPWLEGELAAAFGRRCRELLSVHFPQPITPVTFSNHLRDLPLVGSGRRAALQLFIQEINVRRGGAAGARPATAAEQRQWADFSTEGKKPIAILADIHANLPALEAVLADIDRNGFADGLVLGDLVGYGPHPEACVAAVRRRGFRVLLGNHDYGVAYGEYAKGFSSTGRQVAEWSGRRLNAGDREWLASLPDTLEGEGWMAVHGAPADKSRLMAYVYRMTYEANLDYLQRREIPLCFHGHTHVEGVWYRKGTEDGFSDARSQELSEYDFSLVCPGSVGQPRSGQGPAARYAVFHPATRRVEFRLVDYDVQRTMRDMRENGLPEPLAERLLQGI